MTFEQTPGMGDNVQAIDYAAEESARLRHDYAYLETLVDELFAEADAFAGIDDADSKAAGMSLIKRLRDEQKKILGLHEMEKVPHYRRGQATDQFFFRLADRLAKRDPKRGQDGQADRIYRMLNDYDRRLLAEEQERRRLANEEMERVAREAERVRREAERLAEESRLKAERARIAVHKSKKEEAAREAAEAEARANVEARVAAEKAEEARIATKVTAADIMRTRTEDGTLGTMAEENFAEVTDRVTLDLESLRPYLPMAALQQALNAYARSVGYSSDKSVQIKGANFGKRPKSRVR